MRGFIVNILGSVWNEKLCMKCKVVSSVLKLGMCVLSMKCKGEDSTRE